MLFSLMIDKLLSLVKHKKFIYHKNQIKLLFALSQCNESNVFSIFSIFRQKKINGLYIYGPVGSGKSTIVKIFTGTTKKNVKTSHYNEFMNEIHSSVQKLGQTNNVMKKIIDSMTKNIEVLYIDELQIHDISDAMIFVQFFNIIIKKKILFITTSNYAPEQLYEYGFNRELFEPTINIINLNMKVFELQCQDHRLLRQNRKKGKYIIGLKSNKILRAHWFKINKKKYDTNAQINLTGKRTLMAIKLSQTCGLFSFSELCSKPLWSNDYAIVANLLSYIFIENIPQFSHNKADSAKRFSILIDELYNHKVTLICSSSTKIDDVYTNIKNNVSSRTTSRLKEMCTQTI